VQQQQQQPPQPRGRQRVQMDEFEAAGSGYVDAAGRAAAASRASACSAASAASSGAGPRLNRKARRSLRSQGSPGRSSAASGSTPSLLSLGSVAAGPSVESVAGGSCCHAAANEAAAATLPLVRPRADGARQPVPSPATLPAAGQPVERPRVPAVDQATAFAMVPAAGSARVSPPAQLNDSEKQDSVPARQLPVPPVPRLPPADAVGGSVASASSSSGWTSVSSDGFAAQRSPAAPAALGCGFATFRRPPPAAAAGVAAGAAASGGGAVPASGRDAPDTARIGGTRSLQRHSLRVATPRLAPGSTPLTAAQQAAIAGVGLQRRSAADSPRQATPQSWGPPRGLGPAIPLSSASSTFVSLRASAGALARAAGAFPAAASTASASAAARPPPAHATETPSLASCGAAPGLAQSSKPPAAGRFSASTRLWRPPTGATGCAGAALPSVGQRTDPQASASGVGIPACSSGGGGAAPAAVRAGPPAVTWQAATAAAAVAGRPLAAVTTAARAASDSTPLLSGRPCAAGPGAGSCEPGLPRTFIPRPGQAGHRLPGNAAPGLRGR
jgi:hypothetical protein